MHGSAEILRSYVRLLGRLSGAASVTVYVPAGAPEESDLLVHDGALDPVPELAEPRAAALFHRGFAPAEGAHEGSVVQAASASPGGVLYRIPLRWVLLDSEDEAAGPERRKGRGRPASEAAAWVGLRFEGTRPASEGESGLLRFPAAADGLGTEDWWSRFLGLAAAFAAHTRTVSRTLIDPVTGLPERAEFHSELETALIQAAQTGMPATVLLVGPDDFGWVNERLDRRAGDRVLREIATSLRTGLRSQDHVGRYGGAIFTVILRETGSGDGRRVAENVVARLSDHRYHDGVLRLDFSAGIAVADPTEPLEAHELIRRADQALSAAKRGERGSVRAWERGTDVEQARSLDRLQGIFTGDKAKDYRNMRLLLDSVAVVAGATRPEELAADITERLYEALNARRVGVLERVGEHGLQVLGGRTRTEDGPEPFEVTPADRELVEAACAQGNFVAESGVGAIPLRLGDRCLGAILLEVASTALAFEGSDRRFLDALAAEVAVALDRARLIERERKREREEKERLAAEIEDLRRVLHGSRLAYRSAAIEGVLTAARKVARTDTTVLITGESGTGKEVLAHTLHELSARSDRPLVVVDCSAISPTLIESELFGHEKGAFTGALARKPGRLAQAEGATVFLDEIGDLPLDLQSKLLRFVQEKQFTPVGGVTPRRVDVRIVAATNADLRAKVAEGRFREDLFHRLNVVRLHVPPLRERREDVVHLANLFLQQFAALYRRPAHHFTPAAEEALQAYAWPGNVRELQNLVLTSVLFCEGEEVDAADLQGFGPRAETRAETSTETSLPAAGPAAPDGDAGARLRLALGREIAAALARGSRSAPIGKWLMEDLVLAADRMAGGIVRRGAELLGLPETTYRRQVRQAAERRDGGLGQRSATWPEVSSLLESVVRGRQGDTDVCEWAESCLLEEIDARTAGDVRTAAALLGVTEPTLLRRRAIRHS
jgi:diguanylate cyclase (GGDEF)-like protein